MDREHQRQERRPCPRDVLSQEKKASTEIIWFEKAGENNVWKQHRSVVEQRCYARTEIIAALSEAGFGEIEAISAEELGAVILASGESFSSLAFRSAGIHVRRNLPRHESSGRDRYRKRVPTSFHDPCGRRISE